MRIGALQVASLAMHLEFMRLRRIVIDILLTATGTGSVLPDLQSISLMTPSRTIRVLFQRLKDIVHVDLIFLGTLYERKKRSV